MARFAGIRGNRIVIVSSEPIVNNDLKTIELPSEFDSFSANEIIAYSFVKDNQIRSSLIKKPVDQMKIAFVGNWQMECGIATYNFFLFPEIAKGVGDFKLFIERNDNPTGDIHQFGDQIISDDKVSMCWKRGEPLQQLVLAIKDYSPDIILIGHEFGLFPNAKYWLSFLTQLSDYRIITILHSTFPNHIDKIVFEAPIPEIIVHLEEAKHNLLFDKKISSKISVIPHGCYQIKDQSKLWNNYKSQHTFITFGFGFKYKSFASSIKAAALLLEKYPDIFFTALFSESPQNKLLHQTYYNELIDLIEELGLQSNVSIIRGFQPENIIDSYLRSNAVSVFPYQSIKNHEVFGQSGASRWAMSFGIPVITSRIPHFSNLPSIKADSPEEIATQLDLLFSNKELVKEQVEKQNQFILDNSWENVAKKYLEVFADR